MIYPKTQLSFGWLGFLFNDTLVVFEHSLLAMIVEGLSFHVLDRASLLARLSLSMSEGTSQGERFMSRYVVKAKDLFKHDRGGRFAAFKTALMSAMGQLALQSGHVLIKDDLSSELCGWISFYPSEELVYKAPRISVRFVGKSSHGDPARAMVEVDYRPGVHHRGLMEIEIEFPDDLQGLAGLLGQHESVRYQGLFFNLTPGDYAANLFEAVNSVCDAFELVEALGSPETAHV